MSKLLETKRVKKLAGISSEGLRLWRKRGWLSEPVLRSYGKDQGSGNTLWWPSNVISQIEFIRTLKKCGKTVNEIDLLIKAERELK